MSTKIYDHKVCTGIKSSEETKNKIRLAKTGSRGFHHTEETIEEIIKRKFLANENICHCSYCTEFLEHSICFAIKSSIKEVVTTHKHG